MSWGVNPAAVETSWVNRRIIKVLALLESEHDAEALQALRTAQSLLAKSQLTLCGIVEGYLLRLGRDSSGAVSPDVSLLQSELARYRLAWEQARDDRERLERDVERLKAHLESKDGLKLFVRLREREENVTALTNEIRRLKDELFKAEHRLDQKSHSGRRAARSSESTGGTKAGGPTEGTTVRNTSSEAHDLVRSWWELAGLVPSSDPGDWVSLYQVYDMFLSGRVSLTQKRTRVGGDEDTRAILRRKVSPQKFAACLGALLGAQDSEAMPMVRRTSQRKPPERGFCLRSRFEGDTPSEWPRGA
jgi:hypothetical protein